MTEPSELLELWSEGSHGEPWEEGIGRLRTVLVEAAG